MNKWLIGAAASVSIALVAASCGSSTSSPSSAKTSGKTTIVWSTIQTGTPFATDIVKSFEAENPNIHVTIQIPSGDSNVVRAAYSSALAAGASTPDIYSEDQTWPAEGTLNHWDVNLTKLIPKSYLAGIAPGLLQGYTFRGQLVGVPYFTDSQILYYRKDILAKAHLPVPKTWSQLVIEAKQIIKMKLAKYGLVYFGANFEGTTMFWTSMIADAGGATINPQATASTVNSPAGLKALSFLRSTITAGVTPAADATFGATTPGTVFDEGHTAFMAANAYQWPGVAKSGMKSKVGIAAQPTFPGGPATGAAATGGSASFINPSSKHLQADVKFVEFLTTKTAEFDVAKVGGLAPSSTAVQTNPSVDAINPPAGLLPHLTLVNRPAAEANYPAVTAAISANVNAVISGIASPASALAKMSSEINTALKSSAG